MKAIIAPWVSCCLIGDQEVILDSRRDRYSSVKAGTMENALQSLRTDTNPASNAARRLIADGHVMRAQDEASSGGFCLHPIPKMTVTLLDQSSTQTSADLMIALTALLSLELQFRTRRLDHIISSSLLPRADPPACFEAVVSKTLATFRRARRLLPGTESCLRDSMALRRLLSKQHVHTILVFGVALDPFAAHCWLEVDGMVVGDYHERVGHFTPIRVIE